jgi:hypothetical protein
MTYKQQGGMASSSVREEAVKPILDPPVQGVVFPYRGTETHGVQPAHKPPEYDDDEWTEDDESKHYDQPETEVEPIPVRIVQEFANPRKEIRTRQMPVSQTPVEIVNRNEARSRVWVKNIDQTNAVYIGNDGNVTTVSGYKLVAGAELPGLVVTEDMYATTGDSTTAVLCILEELEVQG